MDARKKVKLTIEITLKDIELLEDFWSTIPICDRHKKLIDKHAERELMTMHYVCKDCEKEYKKQNDACRRIEGKLTEEYYKLMREKDE